MPAFTRTKAYTKTKKISHHNYSQSNYSTCSQNSFLFPITGASIAIDSLLAKNIEKRNSSLKENNSKSSTEKNGKKGKKSQPRLLDNDSFDLSINTTFEKLLKAPDFQQVNYNNSTFEKHEPLFKVQKTYERKIKRNVLSLGKKIKQNRSSKKSLLQLAKKIKTPELSPNGSSLLVARKFTPIASTSKIVTKNTSSVFQPGVRHCMQAQNSPNFLVASTPIIPRHLRSQADISLSPITAKKQLNFQSGWKTLFESDYKSTDNSLPSTPKKDVILINSTLNDEPKQYSLIKNDDKFKAIPIVIIENSVENKLALVPQVNLTRNSFSKYRKGFNKLELNGMKSAYIDLTRYSFTEYLNKNNSKETTRMNLRSRTKIAKPVKEESKKKIAPIPEGVGLRTRSHHTKTRTKSEKVQKPPIKRRLRSNSIHLNSTELNNSVFTKDEIQETNKKPKRTKRNTTINDDKDEEIKIQKMNEESIYIERLLEELKKPVNISKHVPDKELNKEPNKEPDKEVTPVRRSSRQRRKSVLIDEENYSDWGEYQRITQNKTPTNNSLRRTRSTSALFAEDSLKNSVINISDDSKLDIIENTINESVKREKFVTKRRGSSKELKNEYITRRRASITPKISLNEWERFSQNNISSIKVNENQNHIIENSIIEDTFNGEPQNIFLKPGKQWLRSLSILRRTNINAPLNISNKGRKWRDSVCAVFEQQTKPQPPERVGGVLFDTSDNQHNEIFNISTKNLQISRIQSLNRRTTLQIVPLANKGVSLGRNVHSVIEDCENKTGYVSTLADESQSILANFDKLSLTTNVDEREETARQIILKRCGQTHPLPFDDCYSQRSLTRCRKIGEGVYGEVFMYKSLDRQCRVMKIIPIEGNLVVNGEHQKKFEEIISEIIIASELSNLRNNKEFSTNGFNELLKICCVQGKYPQHLLDLWNLYDEEQGSENDSPEIFTDEQLYIVLELANGGQDLEAYRFNNAEQSYAVFAQVVCSLAVAESALQFEHRDMHWGNILISPTNETTITFRLNGRDLEIATKGVNVSIIDFTLSRMTYNNCCIFNDLALDPDLFTATGDYQFDIYRLMRKRNQDDWQRFEPYSNILWLDYTLEKMITQLRYLRINTKTHKTYIRRLTQLRKKIFNYNSATELLNSDAFSQVFLY